MEKPSDDLLAALKCETLGEASLRVAACLTVNPKRRRKVEVMRQLETQTKNRILDYFNQNNIETPNLTGVVLKGAIFGVLFPLSPWEGIIKNTIKETEHYLELFNRLEFNAPEDDKELFKYIVAHEEAIKRFAELESQSCDSDTLKPMTDLLT